MKTVRKAPAKINLFLHMTGKREDGYHLLRSVMQTISLYDEVTVTALPGKREIHLKTEEESIASIGMKNTACRAAKLFMDEIPDASYEITIELAKQIPSQAGLGGGSSDGASTLLALAELFPSAVSPERLAELALKIGADVPFFLQGGTALCEGVGEILTEATPLDSLPILILKPAHGVSTPGCYARFDQSGSMRTMREEEKKILETFLFPKGKTDPCERLKQAMPILWNDLYEPALADAPEMAQAIPLLEKYGAFYSAMSGSGSAMFGVFEKKEQIEELLSSEGFSALKQTGWYAFPVTSV